MQNNLILMIGYSTQSTNNKLPVKYPHSDLRAVGQSITQNFSFGIAPKKCINTNCCQTKMSSQQLLEISQQISTYYAAKLDLSATRLLLLPITPDSLYIYWNLGPYHMDLLTQKLQPGKQWLLKIVAQSINESQKTTTKPVFGMPVNQAQSKQKIILETASKPSLYSASLGILDSDQTFSPVLQTQPCLGYYRSVPLEPVKSLSNRTDYAGTNPSGTIF